MLVIGLRSQMCQSLLFKIKYIFLPCRQYEERELQVQEDRAKKRLEFDDQKQRLLNQLEFERSRDTRGLHICDDLSEALSVE